VLDPLSDPEAKFHEEAEGDVMAIYGPELVDKIDQTIAQLVTDMGVELLSEKAGLSEKAACPPTAQAE